VIPKIGKSIIGGPKQFASVACETKENEHKFVFKSNNFHQNVSTALNDGQRKSILTSKKSLVTNKDNKFHQTRCALLTFNNDVKHFQGPLWLRDNWDQFLDNISNNGLSNERQSVVEVISSFYGFLQSTLGQEVNYASAIMGFEAKPLPNSCMVVVDNDKLIAEGDAAVVVVAIGDSGIEYISQNNQKKYVVEREAKGIKRIIVAPLSLYGSLKANEEVMMDTSFYNEEELEKELKKRCNGGTKSDPVACDGMIVLFC